MIVYAMLAPLGLIFACWLLIAASVRTMTQERVKLWPFR